MAEPTVSEEKRTPPFVAIAVQQNPWWRDVCWWGLAFAGLPVVLALRAAGVGVAVTGASTWVLLTLVYPVLEEVVFRGLLQGQLLRSPMLARRRWLQLSGANCITAAAFAAAHTLRQSLPWAVGIFVPGLVFGWCRDRFGSVWPSVVLHVLYNLLFFGVALSR